MVIWSDVTGLTARRLGVCVFCAATLVAIAKTRTKRTTQPCGLVMSSSAGSVVGPRDSLTSGCAKRILNAVAPSALHTFFEPNRVAALTVPDVHDVAVPDDIVLPLES